MTRRVCIGNFPDGTAGLRCSKAGYDVMTPTPDPTQMTFDSTWSQTLPVWCTSGVHALAGSPNNSIRIPYPVALPYVPMIMGYYSADQQNWVTNVPIDLVRITGDGSSFEFWNSSGFVFYFFAVAFHIPSGM